MARKDPAAVALGRKGGKATAQKLTPEERSEKMRRVVQVRWAKEKRKLEKTVQQLREGTEALLRAAKKRATQQKRAAEIR